MSVLWMDDPSFYNLTEMSQRYNATSTSSYLALPNSTGRFGGSCWEANGSINFAWLQLTVAAIQTGTQAVSYKFASVVSGQQIFSFLDTASTQVDLRLISTGQLQVTRNGTQLAISTNTLLPNVWYRIEMKTKIDPSVGTIEVRVNGSSTGWIPSTGSLNTRNTANSTFNQIQLGNTAVGGSAHTFHNDWVFTDSNTPNADFLGDKRCFLRVPSSNSAVAWTPTFAAYVNGTAYVLGQQLKDSNNNVQRCTTAGTASTASPTWATTGGNTTSVGGGCVFTCVGTGLNPGATNWMAVSESPGDDDNSYNSDSTPGDIDAFGFPVLPAGAQNIAAIDNILRCRKDDAGTRSIATYINSGGTIVIGSTIALSTSYIYVDTINQTDPNTSTAWTVSGLNAATLGYKEIA